MHLFVSALMDCSHFCLAGFESILEGIYGPLPRDLNLFHGGLLVVYALYHWLVTIRGLYICFQHKR